MIEINYRPMPSLTDNEKRILRALTIGDTADGKRSLFKRWIDCYSNQDILHTAIVYSGKDIIGWAAANMGAGWNCGMIGAFIQESYRNNGYARQALEVLVQKLKELYPEEPEYLVYMEEKERLFAPIIESSGFRNMVKSFDEYQVQYKEATDAILQK